MKQKVILGAYYLTIVATLVSLFVFIKSYKLFDWNVINQILLGFLISGILLYNLFRTNASLLGKFPLKKYWILLNLVLLIIIFSLFLYALFLGGFDKKTNLYYQSSNFVLAFLSWYLFVSLLMKIKNENIS